MVAMREKLLKSKLYRVVLWIILLSMSGGAVLLSPFLTRRQSPEVGPIIARINNADITQKQYQIRLAQTLERIELFKQQYGDQSKLLLTLIGLDKPEEVAMRGIIIDELLNQIAQKIHIDLSSEYVVRKLQEPSVLLEELRDIVPLQILTPQGTIDYNALRYVLQMRGQTLADFEESIEKALERKMLTDILGLSVYVSPQEIKDSFSAYYRKKSYDILKFPFSSYLTTVQQTELEEQEIKEFFNEQNKASKRYWIPEKRSGMYWVFSPSQYGVTVPQKDIEAYYNEHKFKKFVDTPAKIQVRRILLKVDEKTDVKKQKELAQDILEKLKKDPTSFAQLAQQHSQDTQTASKGGLMEFIKRGDKDPAFEQAAFRLKKDEDISDVITTGEGLEILQRVAKKPAVYKPLDKVSQEISYILRAKKFKSKFSDDVARILESDPEAIKEKVAQFVEKKQAEKEIVTNKELDQKAWTQKFFKTKKGKYASLIDEKGNGILLYVSDIQKSHEPNLEKVIDEVKKDLYQEKAEKALSKDMQKAYHLARTQNISTVKKEFPVAELFTTEMIKRDDPASYEQLTKKQVPVDQLLMDTEKMGDVALAYAKNNGFVGKITKMEEFNKALFDEKKADIAKDLYTQKKDRTVRGFIASLYDSAKIEPVDQEQSEHQSSPEEMEF